jgi:hypothetical protein
MGYIVVIVVALLIIPILFAFFSKRPASGRELSRSDHGLGPSKPAADQPTPRAGAVNQIEPEASKRIPPG